MISRALTDFEIREIENYIRYKASNRSEIRKKYLCIFALFLIGLRCKEVCGVRVTDILLRGDIVLWLKVETAKRRKAGRYKGISVQSISKYREIPVPKNIANILKNNINRSKEYVVYSQKGGSLSREIVIHKFKKMFDSLGIKNAGTHSFRRTFIQRLAKSGVDLETIRQLVGHQNIFSTMQYLQSSAGAKKRAVSVMDKVLYENIGQNNINIKLAKKGMNIYIEKNNAG